MAEFLKLLGCSFSILLVYICIYGLVSRVCKCVEHHTEWKYRARVDLEWVNAQNRKEGNQNV